MKTAQEFYDFFNVIPDEKWTCVDLEKNGMKCVLGHLGVIYHPETKHYFMPSSEIRENVYILANLIGDKHYLEHKHYLKQIELYDSQKYKDSVIHDSLYSINDKSTYEPITYERIYSPKQNILNALKEKL